MKAPLTEAQYDALVIKYNLDRIRVLRPGKARAIATELGAEFLPRLGYSTQLGVVEFGNSYPFDKHQGFYVSHYADGYHWFLACASAQLQAPAEHSR